MSVLDYHHHEPAAGIGNAPRVGRGASTFQRSIVPPPVRRHVLIEANCGRRVTWNIVRQSG